MLCGWIGLSKYAFYLKTFQVQCTGKEKMSVQRLVDIDSMRILGVIFYNLHQKNTAVSYFNSRF